MHQFTFHRTARRTARLLSPRLQFALPLTLAGAVAFPAAATQEDWTPGGSGAAQHPAAPEVPPARAATFDAPAPGGLGLSAIGPITPAPGQPAGALSGRIVFTSGGHGWTASGSTWVLQRPVLLEMCEDYGNLDQMTLFAFYCFNAGATVVPLRPIGHQTNEVVLDNDDPGVTFSGAWSDSVQTLYYGSPGDVPYRFATIAATETATATYTPNIPVAGFYPVYTWVAHGANRTSQLYRIRHTGGEATVRVPHHMVGNGWVYLGTYYFDAGFNPAQGAVVISNLEPTPSFGSVVIADAIRFGNGMGSIDRGGGVSGYPREEECSRYWVQNSLGQGQSSSLYDDPSLVDSDDNVSTPTRMAREMNREASGNMFQRIYLGFHSNAGGSRGVLGLYNNESLFPGTATSNQFRLAQLVGTAINDEMVGIGAPPLEVAWYNRGTAITFARSDYAFGEIRGDRIGYEMDATIAEVAFHDDASDAKLLRDPKARNWIARASYHAVVRYMNEFDGLPLNFLPEPPYNVRATATAGGVLISWNTPVAQAGSGAPSGYVVYVSTNGYGFGDPVPVSGGGTVSLLLTNLPADTDFYFRVAATNAGGESFPSETVGCRRAANPARSRVLFVNAFDRFDRTTNLRQTPAVQNYVPPAGSGTMERVMPRANNSFDYVVPHGRAVSAFGLPFDSCSKQAVTNDQVSLAGYQIVIWQSGQQTNDVINSAAQTRLTAFQNGGGHLFVSGADIAWSLDRATGPGAADRAFLNNILHADLGADANNNSGSYTVAPVAGPIFTGSGNATFDNGARGIYWVQTPDAFTPTGAGAVAALSYVGGNGGTAAVQFDPGPGAGGGTVIYFGFPFETITSAGARNMYMSDILRFFSQPARFEAIALLPDGRPQLRLRGEPGLTYAILSSSNLLNWTFFTNVTATDGTALFADGPATGDWQKFYRAALTP
jgi:hypothetical protein